MRTLQLSKALSTDLIYFFQKLSVLSIASKQVTRKTIQQVAPHSGSPRWSGRYLPVHGARICHGQKHVYSHACPHIDTHIGEHTNPHLLIQVCTNVYTSTCTYLYAYTHLYEYVCTHAYTHASTHVRRYIQCASATDKSMCRYRHVCAFVHTHDFIRAWVHT